MTVFRRSQPTKRLSTPAIIMNERVFSGDGRVECRANPAGFAELHPEFRMLNGNPKQVRRVHDLKNLKDLIVIIKLQARIARRTMPS